MLMGRGDWVRTAALAPTATIAAVIMRPLLKLVM
jgi:hypothetical protein